MDRDYWRSEPTTRLIEEARTKGCELCRALGERLEDVNDTLECSASEAEDRAVEIDDTICELRRELETLELMLGQREDRIEELEAKLKGKK